MDPSVITHGERPFANPLSDRAIAAAIAALELPPGARALDIGCGTGELLARVPDVYRVGIEPGADRARRARERLDEIHEARFDQVQLEPGSFDLVACVGSSHAIGTWGQALRALAQLARPLGHAIVGEGFWRRHPSDGYLQALGGATPDELPDWDALQAGAIDAGWALVHHEIASDADWADYEETLLANGERAYASDPDPELRAWLDESSARWSHPDGKTTLGFALLTLRRA